jgi:dihydroorotate dehydrogenase (NAD+) catalytic subunit
MSDIRLGELLGQMRVKAGSVRRLATAIDVTEKTANTWLKQGGELRVHADQRDRILAAAAKLGVAPEIHATDVSLWDLRTSYAQNLTHAVPVPPLLPPERPYPTTFLGQQLNSPFGASASVVTCTSGRVRFLGHTCNDVITYKTVRSREYRGHNTPNIFCVDRGAESLDPDRPIPPLKVLAPEDCADSQGFVNRYGMPSPPPERWQVDFASAKSTLLPGQMLMLSVVGTAEGGAGADDLVSDFLRVARMAAEAGADMVELNASCPNCPGKEGMLFHDVALVERVCQTVRSGTPLKKLVLKIGYLKDRELASLVHATAPYVDAYAAINTLPVDARRPSELGDEFAFGRKTKAGLSGALIARFGLKLTKQLRDIREREGLSFGIIGIGGITSPSDVLEYLHAGADVVQAASIFFRDPFFGTKVRRHLVSESLAQKSVAEIEAWTALANVFAATRQLGDEVVPTKLLQASHDVLVEWHANQRALMSAGPRKALPVPSIGEFSTRIKRRVNGE